MTLDDRRPHVGFVAAVVLALSLAACAGEAGTSGAVASATPTPTVEVRVPTAPPLVVDANLLAILPARVLGIGLQPSPETAAGMIANSSLGESASAIAVGIVVAPGASGSDDIAISTVVQLRPGVKGDAFFDDWRHGYDEAACAPAGGVSSHIQQLIGPHTVEVTVCGEGARLYHTQLSGDRLVSITAVGDRKFGDLVMASLRE